MGRVFMVERPRTSVDTSTAERYGHVTFIFGRRDRRCSVFNSSSYGAQIVERLELANFDPARDFVCVVGSMVTVVVALIAAACHYPYLRLLLYRANEGKGEYVIRKVGTAVWKGDSNATGDSQSTVPLPRT